MTLLRLTPALGTHRGLQRAKNEDTVDYTFPAVPDVLLRQGALFVVADGVGGLTAGDLASQYVVNRLMMRYYSLDVAAGIEEKLARAVQRVNEDLYERMRKKSATTLLAAVIVQDQLVVASVGDSVIYLVRGESIAKLNTEDIYTDDGREVPLGTLTQAIGYRYEVAVQTVVGRLQPGDRLLLCTDGLTRYLDAEALRSCVGAADDPRVTVRHLIERANAHGGADNVAVVVIHVGDEIAVQDLIAHIAGCEIAVNIDSPPRQQADKAPTNAQEPPPSPTSWALVLVGALVFLVGLSLLGAVLLLPRAASLPNPLPISPLSPSASDEPAQTTYHSEALLATVVTNPTPRYIVRDVVQNDEEP